MQPFLIRDKDSNYFVVLEILNKDFVLIASKKTKNFKYIQLEEMMNNYMFERTD